MVNALRLIETEQEQVNKMAGVFHEADHPVGLPLDRDLVTGI
jgi:hypothetical protein